MNISVNGQSRIPPGFRFHPTEEELLQYYLRKKVANDKIDLDVIFEVDLNKLEPWDIQEKCRIGTTPQNDWYFFSHKDKKYPTGTRTNRATVAGFWKATGRDKVIYSNCRRIGMRKTLVFYKGRAPHGQKSDWIMHEYRLDDCSNINDDIHVTSHAMNNNNGDFTQEEGWVVCRIFKKKNHIKTLDHHHHHNNNTSSINNNNNNNNNQMSLLIESHSTMLDSPSDHDLDNDQGALEQIFQSLGSKNNVFTRPSFHHRLDNSNSINSISNSISMISNSSNNNNKFMKLPSLESPNNSTTHLTTFYHHPMHPENDVVSAANTSETDLGDWATLDRLVATHLNGHSTTDTTMSSIFSTSSSSLSTSTGCKIYNNITTNNNHNNNNNNSDALENNYGSNNNNNEIIDLWSFTRSTLQIDPLCHVSDGGI